EMILDGRLEQGSRLHQEELSHALGVSRTPLRQALGLLVQEGFVERSTSSHYTVSVVRKDTLYDLYLVRRELDALAAELAAKRHRAGDLRRLDREIAAMEKAGTHDWLAHHRAFHTAVYQAAR